MRPPNGIYATVAVGASVNVVNGEVEEVEEEGFLQEADDFADQQFQDEEGELFPDRSKKSAIKTIKIRKK